MKYYVGILLNQNVNFQLRKVVGDVGRIFDDQAVTVRWLKPELYRLDILDLGTELNPIKRFIIINKLKKYNRKRLNILTHNIQLGRKRLYKGSIYMTLIDGGDVLRSIFYDLSQILKNSISEFFIPCINIGRINEDLSSEQIRNMDVALRVFNEKTELPNIAIEVDNLYLYSVDENTIKVIKEFPLID